MGTIVGVAAGATDTAALPARSRIRTVWRLTTPLAIVPGQTCGRVRPTLSKSNVLYTDTFSGSGLNSAWKVPCTGGSGRLPTAWVGSQTSTTSGATPRSSSSPVYQRQRRSEVVGSGSCRFLAYWATRPVLGLVSYTNASGDGYNLLFRDNGKVQFLDDQVRLGQQLQFRLADRGVVQLQVADGRRGAQGQGMGGWFGRADRLDVHAIGLDESGRVDRCRSMAVPARCR